MRQLKAFCILIIFTGLFSSLSGQTTTHQNLIWLRYFTSVKLTDKVSIHTEIEERSYIAPYRQHQRLIPNLSVAYLKQDDIIFNLGATYFQQYLPHDAAKEPSLYNEIRPHQSISLIKNVSNFKFTTRLQIEQRFMEDINHSFLFISRERFLFRSSYPLIRSQSSSWLEAIIFNEILVQQGKDLKYNFFDQNRLGAGVKTNLNESLQIEALLVNWHQQQSTLVDFFNRNILWLTLFHTI